MKKVIASAVLAALLVTSAVIGMQTGKTQNADYVPPPYSPTTTIS